MILLTHFKQTTPPLVVTILLGCFALSPTAQAVSPPPDGGYPGFNTAEGQNALLSLTTGAGNTGFGWYSLFANSTNNFNTGVGAGTLVLNTADNNTAVGTGALLLNTTGTEDTAVGSTALLNNTTGGDNTALGFKALFSNTIGELNGHWSSKPSEQHHRHPQLRRWYRSASSQPNRGIQYGHW
ncbi:MAG TPA: hypothetical protein VGM66_08925 [Candidatus Udaeobacter sp.]|jgi:hypothetical protein